MEAFEECIVWWLVLGIVGAPICPLDHKAWLMGAITRVYATARPVLSWTTKRVVASVRRADRVGRRSVIAVLSVPVRTSRR